jgi:hypothetical protein
MEAYTLHVIRDALDLLEELGLLVSGHINIYLIAIASKRSWRSSTPPKRRKLAKKPQSIKVGRWI